ncbi:Cobalamin synthase [Rubellimicrobium mesophilum DSM 19309]|uniref:Adenosylcobinamide-GDP ribazoletransferase n=1 Tax=Rubellimicrobium mesophilum DSM 19309 TaxID=442562 RepID=A0A017HK03_9RHOB|nr:adenosylcobinamide-GDP ribazoletransferase [Rubellimicrobium mesophilum]EYD74483.1 Cobalamin synthase [Rubellimicrobium mesophilum DSM 19309]
MPYSEVVRPSDPVEAVLFLTRLPLRWPLPNPRGARASWAWPLAGAVVGALAAAGASLALAAGLPPNVAAALALVVQAFATGALHEDGLADSADGLWGGSTRERRLEIMRDSRIGSYGAVALVLSLLIRWSAVLALLAQGATWGPLIAAGALSRWSPPAMLWALRPAREGGLSRLIGRPAGATLALGGATAVLVALLATGLAAASAVLWVGLVTLAWGLLVRARLGGQTGDTCGAAQQLAEMAALLALLA